MTPNAQFKNYPTSATWNVLENHFLEKLPASSQETSTLIHENLLPASAKRPVELHQALILLASRLRQSEFRVIERSLAVEYLEISRSAALVAHDGKADRLFQVRDELLLLNSNLMEFLVCDQRIGHISEGALNGLLIRDECLLVLRFREMQIPA